MKSTFVLVALLLWFAADAKADLIQCEITKEDTYLRILDNEITEMSWDDDDIGVTTYEFLENEGVRFVASEYPDYEEEAELINGIEWSCKNDQYYGAKIIERDEETFATSIIFSDTNMVFSSTTLALGLVSAFVFGEVNCSKG